MVKSSIYSSKNNLRSQIVTLENGIALSLCFKTKFLRFQFGTLKNTNKMLWK